MSRTSREIVRAFLIVAVVVAIASLFVGCNAESDSPIPTGPSKIQDPPPAPPPPPAASQPTAAPTPDPKQDRSYIMFTDGCAGTWCAVKGSARRVSIIATIPMRNDAASIYGEWFIEAKEGECVEFARAEQYLKFPWCGEQEVQCDASLGYGGGAHAGHIFSKVKGYDCPGCDENATWRELPPEVTYTEWSGCSRVVAASSVSASFTPACSQSRKKTTVVNEIHTCTEEIREKSRTEEQETQSCDCECVEENPNGTKTLGEIVWSGEIEEGPCPGGDSDCHEDGTQAYTIDYTCKEDESGTDDVCRRATCESECDTSNVAFGVTRDSAGNPTDECKSFGDFVPACKTEGLSSSDAAELPSCPTDAAAFYICKAGNQMVAVANYTTSCPGISSGWSHTTGCACAEVD